MPNWKRRGGAFIIDYAIVFLVIGVVDNLLYFPFPEIFLSLISLFLFSIYFVAFEGGPGRNASPGKRLLKLQVVAKEGNNSYPRKALVRSLVVGTLCVFDWRSLPLVVPNLPIPNFVVLALGAAQVTLLLYNIWLCREGESYLMLQDRWTNTRVVGEAWAGALPSEDTNDPLISKVPHQMGLGILFFVALTCGVLIGLSMGYNVFGVSYGKEDLRWIVQNSMEQQFGIRTRCEITEMIHFSTGEDSGEKRLLIKLWIPYARWDEAQFGGYVNAALSRVKMTPGYYDSGMISLWTGGFLNINKNFDLTLPE